jgi:hypothetical protein
VEPNDHENLPPPASAGPLEHERVLWRDLGRPLRDFVAGLADGPRDAIARWAAVEEVLATHGLDLAGTLRARAGGVTLEARGRLADGLLRALDAVLGAPVESRGDAEVRWHVERAGRPSCVVVYRLARGEGAGEELAIDWAA